jgi:hypothetical protein
MSRSRNQKHHHWDIDDPHSLLAVGSEPRRMVDVYKAQTGCTQPQAVADLLSAGYGSLVGIPLSPKVAGPTPMQRRMGRVH